MRQGGMTQAARSSRPYTNRAGGLVKLLFLAGVLSVGFCGVASAQCVGGVCYGPAVQIRPATVPVPPPVIYGAQITYQPMQYQSTMLQRRTYRGPIFNALFGRYRVVHTYAPMQNGNGRR